MLAIKETTAEDLPNVQSLWADGDVMRYVGFPDGLLETDEAMQQWLEQQEAARPAGNHFSIYENGQFCGETGYGVDKEHASAWLDIKLFRHARDRGIATRAITFAMEEAFRNGANTVWVDPAPENAKAIALYKRLGFQQSDMLEHVIALGEDPATNLYFERGRA